MLKNEEKFHDNCYENPAQYENNQHDDDRHDNNIKIRCDHSVASQFLSSTVCDPHIPGQPVLLFSATRTSTTTTPTTTTATATTTTNTTTRTMTTTRTTKQ